jgi:hypothetical protein
MPIYFEARPLEPDRKQGPSISLRLSCGRRKWGVGLGPPCAFHGQACTGRSVVTLLPPIRHFAFPAEIGVAANSRSSIDLCVYHVRPPLPSIAAPTVQGIWHGDSRPKCKRTELGKRFSPERAMGGVGEAILARNINGRRWVSDFEPEGEREELGRRFSPQI